MKKITPKKILFLIFGFFLIFWRFISLLTFPDSQIILQKGDPIKLRSENTLTQNFNSVRDGLSKIEILLRTPGIKFKDGDIVKAQIAEANCEKIIRENTIKKSFLNSDNLYEFDFPAISNSAEKEFCLKLTFLPKKKSAKSIQIFKMGNLESAPLSIRPAYKNKNLQEDISELNKRISQYKPWFLKHYFLYIFSFGFIIFSIFLITLLILY